MTTPMIYDGQRTRPMTAAETAAYQTQQQTAAAEQTTAQQQLAAATEKALLEMRNRWLAQTDSYILGTFPGDLPQPVIDAITANLDEIKTWRQQLRDWPASVTDWTQPPPLPAPPAITLPSGRQLIIVT